VPPNKSQSFHHEHRGGTVQGQPFSNLNRLQAHGRNKGATSQTDGEEKLAESYWGRLVTVDKIAKTTQPGSKKTRNRSSGTGHTFLGIKKNAGVGEVI